MLPMTSHKPLPPKPDLLDLQLAALHVRHLLMTIRCAELRKDFLTLRKGLSKRRAEMPKWSQFDMAVGLHSLPSVRRGLTRAPQRRFIP